MKKYNIAIVGAGRITDLHAKAYEEEPRAVLHTVCDLDEEVARARAEAWGAQKWTTSFEELLADEEIDAVEICTPTSLHPQMTIQAALAGKHISVQKPMALNVEDAQAMVAACEEAGVLLKVCENYVFYPPLVRAKALIEEGAIGQALNLNIRMIGAGSGGWEIPSEAWQWRFEEAKVAGGTQTFDHGHHMFSSAWFLLGKIDKLHGWINSHDGIIDTPASFHWNYADGVAQGGVQFITSSQMHIPSSYYSNDEWFEIVGTTGILWVNQCTAHVQKELPPLTLYRDGKREHIEDLATDWVEGFKGALHNFVDMLEGKAPGMLSGAEGVEILATALAAQKSHQQERTVYIEEMLGSSPESIYRKRHKQDVASHSPEKPSFWNWIFGGDDEYAAQCPVLMEALPERFDPTSVAGWEAHIHLDVSGPHGGQWTMVIHDDTLDFSEGLEGEHDLKIVTNDGTWAAILSGKRGVESAFIQHKLRLEGKVEWGLTLKKAFNL